MGGHQSKERVKRGLTNKNECESLHSTSSLWIAEDAGNPALRNHLPPSSMSPLSSKFLIAVYDFNATGNSDHQSQISVEKDDKLRLFAYSPDGDWVDVECCRTGERGWVPSNHTASISVPSDNDTQMVASGSAVSSNTASSFQQPVATTRGGLASERWYHGAIQRAYAEYLLNSGITGSFLVRESESKPGQLTISLRYEGHIYHYRIQRKQQSANPDTWHYYVTESAKFTSPNELVRYHEKHADGLMCSLLYPAPKPASTTTSDLLGVNSSEVDMWEMDRTEIIMKHKLGSGQYGVVYEALWIPHNILVAVKTLKEDVTVRDEFLEEARVMKNLRHPNLVELLGACTREPPYYIVTEFMCNGNLLEYLRTRSRDELTPPILLHMATQVASAMAYLEQHNFIHRDLAARNCLVGDQRIIKVADFGLARCIARDLTYRAHEGAKFPIKWTAPEGLVYNVFSTKSDVWAFGVLLWEIATYGKTPYPGIELQDVYVFLEKGNRMDQPEGCPKQIFELMLQCWQWHPEQRPKFNAILSRLESMQSDGISIDEQVAMELASSEALRPGATAAMATAGTNQQHQQPTRSAAHRPPLPLRPPPPLRWSNSCDPLDDTIVDAEASTPDETAASFTNASVIKAHSHPMPPPPNPLVGTRVRGGPTRSPGSAGRRRSSAPRPPRRTTPVKPFHLPLSEESGGSSSLVGAGIPWPTADQLDDVGVPHDDEDFPNGAVLHPLPPPPPPTTAVTETSSRPRFQQAGHGYPSPIAPRSFPIPSVMSSSAIFPASSMRLSSHQPAVTGQPVKPTRPCHPPQVAGTAPDGKSAACPITVAASTSGAVTEATKAVALMQFASAAAAAVISRSTAKSDGAGIQRQQPARTSNASVPAVRKNASMRQPSSDFRDELRQRLQHQQQRVLLPSTESIPPGQTKEPAIYERQPIAKRRASPSEVDAATHSDVTCNNFFTLPRLRSTSTAQAQPSTPTSEANSTQLSEPPRTTVHAKVNSAPTPAAPSTCSTTKTTLPTPSTVTNSTVPVRPLQSPLTTANTRTTGGDKSRNRLSWTGPPVLHHLSNRPLAHDRSHLPTILSTSSMALDSVDEQLKETVTLSQADLIGHLREVAANLRLLQKPSERVEVEQLIAVAEEMEVCRVDCSSFIDQASCTARAKFALRDRYASLQNLSCQLRACKSTDQHRSELVTRALKAVVELSEELAKLSCEDAVAVEAKTPQASSSSSEELDRITAPPPCPLLQSQFPKPPLVAGLPGGACIAAKKQEQVITL